jgi:molecular chaperone DnaK
MKKEAELHESDDKKKKEEVETRNQADNLAYTAEKTIKDMGDKVDAATKEKVQKGIEELRKSLGGTDTAKIKQDFESLQKDVYEMSSQVYKAQQPQDQGNVGANQDSPKPGGDDKTVNADWKESDQK